MAVYQPSATTSHDIDVGIPNLDLPEDDDDFLTDDDPTLSGDAYGSTHSNKTTKNVTFSRDDRRSPRGGSKMQPFGEAMPVTINMHDNKDSNQQPSSESHANPSLGDHVEWETLVYDYTRDPISSTSVAVVKYVDNSPMDPRFLMSRPKKSKRAEVPVSSTSKLSTWSGPAIIVRHQVSALMPQVTCTYPEKSRYPSYDLPKPEDKTSSTARIFNSDRLPQTLDGLDIKTCSRPSLIIKSPHLYQELAEIIVDYPFGFELLTDAPTPDFERKVPYPYVMLLASYQKITDRLYAPTEVVDNVPPEPETKEEDEEEGKIAKFKKDSQLALSHLRTLQKFLEPIHKSEVMAHREKISEMNPKVSFHMLWNFFKPGTTVYVTDQWTPWYAAMVSDIDLIQSSSKTSECWKIWHWVLSSDGTRMARREQYLELMYYDGVADLTSLQMCPTKYWDHVHGDGRRKQALQRGKFIEKVIRKGHLLANYSDVGNNQDIKESFSPRLFYAN